ncbi:nitroreductase family protein [Corynebacterium choanae]|uniref:NAD(P)H nitroreductase MhqN n=1 Tax=Corynebacterium choanae TaxID=1862358 RepID=A0A3G6J9V0_9CORY|nr:nitroreductase family protein [Corynebacterium choanae]AZA14679.1 Putative NAD(P)H nitroreductase MhqN [Corynebacterium choanae]
MSLTVTEAITSRRATRVYADTPVTDAVLDRVVAHALEAPSAFNLQLRDLVVVRDQSIKDQLAKDSGQQQFAAAPVVLVAVARVEALPEDIDDIMPVERQTYIATYKEKRNASQLREDAMKDAMLMAGFALIAAQGEGLATGPATGWDEQKVKEALGLGDRDDRAIALVIPMGYPGETPAHPGRQANRRINDRYDA